MAPVVVSLGELLLAMTGLETERLVCHRVLSVWQVLSSQERWYFTFSHFIEENLLKYSVLMRVTNCAGEVMKRSYAACLLVVDEVTQVGFY